MIHCLGGEEGGSGLWSSSAERQRELTCWLAVAVRVLCGQKHKNSSYVLQDRGQVKTRRIVTQQTGRQATRARAAAAGETTSADTRARALTKNSCMSGCINHQTWQLNTFVRLGFGTQEIKLRITLETTRVRYRKWAIQTQGHWCPGIPGNC